jgi:hypothetical protein
VFFTAKRLRLYLGALLIVQVCTLVSGVAVLRTARGHYTDFRSFYTAGFMLRTQQAAVLYDYPTEQRLQSVLAGFDRRALPMMSPPFTALLFVPLSYLRLNVAHLVWSGVSILLLLACIALLKPFLPTLSGRWRFAPALLLLSFLPVALVLLVGQISILILFLYCACFVALRRDRNFLAGLILSLALMKFQVALPVAVLFLFWRQWRFVGGFFTGGVLLTALSIRILGLAAFTSYLHSLYFMTHAVNGNPAVQLHFAILPYEMPNLYGLLFFLAGGAAWSHLLILAVSLALFVWAIRQRPSLSLALLTAMLVSYHLFFYDLTLLIMPLSLLADHLLGRLEPRTSQPRDYRLLITQVSLSALLLAPFARLLIAGDETCWMVLPVLGLTLFSGWWPSLHGLPQTAPLAQSALAPAAASGLPFHGLS